MLPRANRLRDRDIVKKVFEGESSATPFFTVWKKNISTPPQITVIIRTKVSKKAVTRNKIRRRIYEAFGEISSEVPKSLKVIVIVSGGSVNANYHELKKALLGAISK